MHVYYDRYQIRLGLAFFEVLTKWQANNETGPEQPTDDRGLIYDPTEPNMYARACVCVCAYIPALVYLITSSLCLSMGTLPGSEAMRSPQEQSQGSNARLQAER